VSTIMTTHLVSHSVVVEVQNIYCVLQTVFTQLCYRASDSCLMLDYVHLINFCIIIIII